MLRRDLLRLRNAIVPLAEVCGRLEHADVMPIDHAMQPMFRDVTDHVRRVQEEIDALREVLAFAFEASLMTGQAQQTLITRRLAAWAAILAVPTAVAGIYGMNFEHMPELKWTYGYFRRRSASCWRSAARCSGSFVVAAGCKPLLPSSSTLGSGLRPARAQNSSGRPSKHRRFSAFCNGVVY